MRVGIVLHLLHHEATSLVEFLVGHGIPCVFIRGGLRRGDLARGGDAHGGRTGLLSGIVVGLQILREEGGRQAGSQIAQCQEHHEADQSRDDLLHVAGLLLGLELLLDDGVDFLVGEVAAVGDVVVAHGLFGLVELAGAVDIVFGGDGREAILALGGEGLFGDGVGGGCVVDRGGVRFDGGIVVVGG